MSNAKEKNNKKVKTGSYLKEVLSGSMVTDKIVLKNLWYLLLLTLLGALYIGNRFHAEKVTRETARLTREIKDMRAESLTTSTELMYASKQSEVFRMVREKGLGLEELKTPPYRLVVDKK
jgi:hypothetical protein